MSVLMGLESPSQRTLVIVILISSGVALASYGEIDLFVPSCIYVYSSPDTFPPTAATSPASSFNASVSSSKQPDSSASKSSSTA
jgi:hypothetical protein